MERHTVIAIIAISAIILSVGSSFWNVYASNNLQMRGMDGTFSFYELTTNKMIQVCNTLPIMASFEKFSIYIFFDGELKGTYSVDDTTVMPNSIMNFAGKYASESFAESQYIAFHFDGMFGETTPIRIDPRKLNVMTEFQTPILGFIPYSTVNQYSGLEFWNLMNEKNEKFGCL